MAEFDPGKHEIVRGKVYAKGTGRFLGLAVDFDEPVPVEGLDDLSVKELRTRAKDLGLTGYSALSKDDLIAAIQGVESQGGDDGEDSSPDDAAESA